MVSALKPDQLFTACPADRFSFETTRDLDPLRETVGQDRAVEAVSFAINMPHGGFNLFALGPGGTGKSSLIRRALGEAAADRPAPDDWCYVNNFDDPHRPKALRLAAGQGRALHADMAHLIDDLSAALPAAFESDEYSSRKSAIEEEFKERHEDAFGALAEKAQKDDIALIRTPIGLALAPVKDGEVLSPKDFEALEEEDRRHREAAMETLQAELQEILHEVPKWEKEQRERIRDLDRDITQFAVGHLIDALKKNWSDNAGVIEHLNTVETDVVEQASAFLESDAPQGLAMLTGGGRSREDLLRRYEVNVVVDNTHPSVDFAPEGHGFSPARRDAPPPTDDDQRQVVDQAPVVYEDHPTQPNLVGRIEHVSQMGALVTDFTLIKGGALHRANGGFLVLDARKLLMQPFAWETLSRSLRAGHIRIESAADSMGWSSTLTLQPEPIPLDVKVVLMGEPWLYYLLAHYEPDFRELFKVAADFDTRMDRDGDGAMHYARLLAGVAQREGLRPLDAGAVARIVEHGARLAEDSEKITTHMASIVDLAREADYWAGQDDAKVTGRKHVQRAIDAGIYRSDRIRDRIQEEIHRGTLVVQTDGNAVGEINGLAVYQLDHFSFGKPSRISCRVRMGKGDVVDIEREVELGGSLHSKGVMILSSFLQGRFLPDQPLALHASLVFEQSYGGVDGDSASSTELYVLMSALADLPLRQDLAVTGSVDQHGRVQAIGGVNEKIEGFFDVCARRGLTGNQGVLIPDANVKHLMLREDVVQACRDGQFAVYPVSHIDEGIELLTGKPAGERDKKGIYPLGSVNRAVEARLKSFAAKLHEAPPEGRRGTES